jgi:hypothetical protein
MTKKSQNVAATRINVVFDLSWRAAPSAGVSNFFGTTAKLFFKKKSVSESRYK